MNTPGKKHKPKVEKVVHAYLVYHYIVPGTVFYLVFLPYFFYLFFIFFTANCVSDPIPGDFFLGIT